MYQIRTVHQDTAVVYGLSRDVASVARTFIVVAINSALDELAETV